MNKKIEREKGYIQLTHNKAQRQCHVNTAINQ